MAEVKCPNCDDNEVSKTGFSHRVGAVAKMGNRPSSRSTQYKCRKCGALFNYPDLSEMRRIGIV